MTEEEKSSESPPQWEYKEEFGIVGEMKKVINLTIQATEMELEALRRKLERLTYGG